MAKLLARRAAAEPGPYQAPAFGTVPALRSGMKNAAPRPGHESAQTEISRLPPTPAARLACGDCSPSSVRTADFSASAFFFMMVAAICICVLPACVAIAALTKLMSMHKLSVAGENVADSG